MANTNYELFISLAIALGVGFLIGLQREQASAQKQRSETLFLGGVRTHPMIALAGSLSVLIGREVGSWFPAAVLLFLLVPVALAYWDNLSKGLDRRLTSEVTLILTFMLGALVMSDRVLEPFTTRLLVVSSAAVAVTGLLSVKEPLHALVRKVSQDDFYATLRFLIVTVIILPLLPDRTYDPLEVLNPFHIGTMIVLIAGISFVGYVAIRVLGPGRGIGLTGLVGGLASSTAVTLAFSARARQEPGAAAAFVVPVLLASTIMFARILVEVAVVYPPLLASVKMPMGAMLGAGVLVSAFAWYQGTASGPAEGAGPQFVNPFELGSAVKFGLLFAVILFVSKAATTYLGTGGIYLAGLLAGTTDVDAITLSMANLAKGGLSHAEASTAILLGAASNTLVKAGLAIGLGGWPFGRWVAMGFTVILASGVLGLGMMWWL